MIDYSEEYEKWFDTLDPDAQEALYEKIIILGSEGPCLGRPLVDQMKNSRHKNMKELRVQNKKRIFRVFFAFDPESTGILLCGGNKRGENDKEFYSRMIPIADAIYRNHLDKISQGVNEDERDKKKHKK